MAKRVTGDQKFLKCDWRDKADGKKPIKASIPKKLIAGLSSKHQGGKNSE